MHTQGFPPTSVQEPANPVTAAASALAAVAVSAAVALEAFCTPVAALMLESCSASVAQAAWMAGTTAESWKVAAAEACEEAAVSLAGGCS
eukprot:CAMPEP_0197713200 /NCGR_PEP_ID=MMETSP1338-20131121/130339_1 /TAXON_ID=43686 ORGANISM="Pelagodinium beii, Strain RCC1491" /NCGR_SAMPLE_ID=MMETSP1338 /ASSEMBLY_ACC=CAM_ASM_000754 /LENGTH=89 /DNA_ID=CAMNT_0043297139 /DNA_START=507 /DNA_END=777 /DNA_ORIENTATION=-